MMLLVLEAPAATENLPTVVARFRAGEVSAGFGCELAPAWVGTVRELIPESLARWPELVEQPVRFEVASVFPRLREPGNALTIGTKFGPNSSTESTRWRESLPAVATITNVTSMEGMRSLLGVPEITDAGVGNWSLFTVERDGRLRVLRVSAGWALWERDFARMARARNPLAIETNGFRVRSLREGFFKPADANSREELERFPTGERLFEEHEARKANRRQEFGPALRKLVEAREKPGDSDMEADRIAMSEARRNPTQELMEQFAENLDEGTMQIAGMLDDYLFDSQRIEPWDESKRIEALRHLTEALPHAKTSSGLTRLLTVILRSQGGGELKIMLGGKVALEFGVELQADGYSARHQTTPAQERVNSAAWECRYELRRKYPALK